MKFQLLFLIMLLLAPSISAEESYSTFYMIRHAEKNLSIKPDPPLTDAGRLRSRQWAEVFSQIKLDFVYTTDTTRTRDTAVAVANQQGLELSLYSPKNFDYDKFIKQHRNQKVLVVGHSNTSPAFANGLLGEDKYPELDESVHGTLYVVDVADNNRRAQIFMINPVPAKQ